MNFDLQSFMAIVEASTPEGRWNLLQDFLKKNPEWKEKVDRWLTLPPDTAIIQLQADLAERMNIPLPLFSAMLTTEIRLKAKAAIETLQQCYRERNNQTEKEISHGDQRRSTTVPRRSGKNPKRTNTGAKRTDQDRD